MRRGKPEADLTAEADGEKSPSGESSSLVPPLSRDKDEKPPGDTAEPSTPKGGRVRARGRRPDARHARAPQVDAERPRSELGAMGE